MAYSLPLTANRKILGRIPYAVRHKPAFTLIELLLYMGLVGIFLTAATTSMWDIILGNVKSSVEQEVQESLRYSSSRLGFEIRNADSVGSSSDFDINLA